MPTATATATATTQKHNAIDQKRTNNRAARAARAARILARVFAVLCITYNDVKSQDLRF